MNSRTFFIVPKGATSSLTDDGWVFDSTLLLSKSVVDKVIAHFDVYLVEEYLGIRKFTNDKTQINVVLNDAGMPTELSLRTALTDRRLEILRSLLENELVDIVDSRNSPAGANFDKNSEA